MLILRLKKKTYRHTHIDHSCALLNLLDRLWGWVSILKWRTRLGLTNLRLLTRMSWVTRLRLLARLSLVTWLRLITRLGLIDRLGLGRGLLCAGWRV